MTGMEEGPDLRRVGAHPDHWYAVAWSRDLRPGAVLGARFGAEPIVLVRPREGGLFALEDRCAHRQVPLRHGVVEGCAIRCGYHGWRYDASGACIDVPYLGRGKLPNGVRAYRCQEKAGLIFVFPGEAARAADTPLPELSAARDPAYKARRITGPVACHYSFMHENLMDMNHQFLHRRQMGQIAPRFRGMRGGADWFEVDYTFARTGGEQPWGEAAIVGRRGRGEGAHRDLMRIRTQYPHQELRIWTSGEAPVMELWISYTPDEATQRACRTFGLLSVRRPKPGLLLDLAWPALIWFTNRIFREDRWIVELEQAAHDAQGADANQEVFPPIRELRALLRRCGTPPASDVPRALTCDIAAGAC